MVSLGAVPEEKLCEYLLSEWVRLGVWGGEEPPVNWGDGEVGRLREESLG